MLGLIAGIFAFTHFPFFQSAFPGNDPTLTVRHDNHGIFTATIKGNIPESASLVVFDATGKYIFLKTIRAPDTEINETVDLSRFPRGIYIFEFESNNARETKKVVYQ
jgi:hypothetical protein